MSDYIVYYDHTAMSNEPLRMLKVVNIVGLVSVDENKVERLVLVRRNRDQGFHGWANKYFDLRAQPCRFKVFLCSLNAV